MPIEVIPRFAVSLPLQSYPAGRARGPMNMMRIRLLAVHCTGVAVGVAPTMRNAEDRDGGED